jgi:hypothetical protein
MIQARALEWGSERILVATRQSQPLISVRVLWDVTGANRHHLALVVRGGQNPVEVAGRLRSRLETALWALAQRSNPDGRRPMVFCRYLNQHGASELRLSELEGLDRSAVSDICLAAADGSGGRLRSLGLLAWEAEDWLGHGRRYPVPAARLERLVRRKRDPRWRGRFASLLAHDAAVGAQDHPDALADLHLGLTPTEELVATMVIGGFKGDSFPLSSLHLDQGLWPALTDELAERGWLTRLLPLPDIQPGARARQLTRRDLVEIR